MADISIPKSDRDVQNVPFIKMMNGVPHVSSLDIAEKFQKRHTHVLRLIEKIVDDLPASFHQPNFGLMSVDITVGNGATRKSPAYALTRDAFSLVVMGFTGKEALAWKVRYIEAFNAMEEELEERKPSASELPSSDAPLTPDQQCTLQAIVRAKVEALPLEQQGKGRYPQVWSRFNNHFRLSSYKQLPQARMSEAVAYLTKMEVLPPVQDQLALPATSAVLDERAQKVLSLVNDVKQRGNEFISSLFGLESALRFRRATMDSLVPPLGRALERNLPSFSTSIGMNVSALCGLLDVYVGILQKPDA